MGRDSAPLAAGGDLREPLLDKSGAGPRKAEEGLFLPGSPLSSIALLCSSAVGAGVLALPYAVSCVGVLPALCLFAAAGSAASYSNLIIFECAQKQKCSSYGALMAYVMGRHGAAILDVFVAFEGLASLAAYLVFIMDFVPQVCELFGEDVWCTDRSRVAAVASLVIWPLSCLKGLSSLRFVSTCSICTIFLTSLIVVVKAPSYFSRMESSLVEAVTKVQLDRSGFQAFSVACFAFMTHTNSVEIAADLKRPSRGMFRKVIGIHWLFMWAVYCTIGVCGYVSFLEGIEQDFLKSYEINDGMIVLCRCLLSLTLVFACPINMFPSMQALFNAIEHFSGSEPRSLYLNNQVRIPVTTACFAAVVGVALRTPNIADLIASICSILTSPLMFAFPAFMYWRILGKKDVLLPGALVVLTGALWASEIFLWFVPGQELKEQ